MEDTSLRSVFSLQLGGEFSSCFTHVFDHKLVQILDGLFLQDSLESTRSHSYGSSWDEDIFPTLGLTVSWMKSMASRTSWYMLLKDMNRSPCLKPLRMLEDRTEELLTRGPGLDLQVLAGDDSLGVSVASGEEVHEAAVDVRLCGKSPPGRLKFVEFVQRNVGERMNFRPERLKSVLRV